MADLKTVVVDGSEVIVVKERGAGDGGLVLNHLVHEADDTFSNYRHWFSDPVLAGKEHDALSVDTLRARVALARKVADGIPIVAEDVPPPASATVKGT